MANIAAVFHWPLQAMVDLTLPELMEWQERARARIPSPEE
ncbi:GpE family phage tail protein [Massilia sp. YIM B02763]|nr:GpE family phage tail protein [Massilia sp. YIM B02763]MDN4056350.1 GpE family phage tail protein [Massilia sp. YIM B02763]